MSGAERTKKPRPAIPADGLSIADAARYSGVSVHTLRYYERAGLLATIPARTSGGTRRYYAEDLKWIRVCTRLRATGMSTALIRRYAELVQAGAGNEQERLEIFEAHRAKVLEQLAVLTENLSLIDHKIDVYQRRIAEGDADTLWSTTRAAVTSG